MKRTTDMPQTNRYEMQAVSQDLYTGSWLDGGEATWQARLGNPEEISGKKARTGKSHRRQHLKGWSSLSFRHQFTVRHQLIEPANVLGNYVLHSRADSDKDFHEKARNVNDELIQRFETLFAALEALRKWYLVDEAAYDFLLRQPELASILVEAAPHLLRIFPESTLRVELYVDPEDETLEELHVTAVATPPLEVDDYFDRLQLFDEAFALANSAKMAGRVVFDAE